MAADEQAGCDDGLPIPDSLSGWYAAGLDDRRLDEMYPPDFEEGEMTGLAYTTGWYDAPQPD